MPALEALLSRFAAANTQPLGVSVDSIHCHANWGSSLGGVSFPLLADFHPKGAVAQSFGVYLEDKGITDRATVIVDAGGTVRYAESVTPAGKRDMDELASACERVASRYEGELTPYERPAALPPDLTLYVKNHCGFSRATQLACDNLHLHDKVRIANVSEDSSALGELRQLTGKDQAPCLMGLDEPMLESPQIVRYLAAAATGLDGD